MRRAMAGIPEKRPGHRPRSACTCRWGSVVLPELPTWASGWTRLPVLSVSSDYLGTAYQIATAAGSYAAVGTTSNQWMASIVTLKTS